MAVHTKISNAEINEFFKNYAVDEIVEFNGIQEGVERQLVLI